MIELNDHADIAWFLRVFARAIRKNQWPDRHRQIKHIRDVARLADKRHLASSPQNGTGSRVRVDLPSRAVEPTREGPP